LFSLSISKEDLEPLAKEVTVEKYYEEHDAKMEAGFNIIYEHLGITIDSDSVRDTLKYPGYSINLLGIVQSNPFARRAYLMDRGETEYRNRISLYLNERNDLSLGIRDGVGDVYTLTLPYEDINQYLDTTILLTAEYGEKEGTSFLWILVNAEEIKRLDFERNLHLAGSIPALGSTIGSNLRRLDCSDMYLLSAWQMRGTLTTDNINSFRSIIDSYVRRIEGNVSHIGCGDIKVTTQKDLDQKIIFEGYWSEYLLV